MRRLFDGKHWTEWSRNNLKSRVTPAVLVFFLLPIALLVLKCAWDNHQDNVDAVQLLKKLKSEGLPLGATLKDEGSEVGNWVGSSNLLQIMAYRVFTCSMSEEEIETFYGTELRKNPSEDFHVVVYGKTNLLTPDEIITDFNKFPKSEQHHTYAIYRLDCPTGGIDIRGW